MELELLDVILADKSYLCRGTFYTPNQELKKE